jgi:hypothetical protein
MTEKKIPNIIFYEGCDEDDNVTVLDLPATEEVEGSFVVTRIGGEPSIIAHEGLRRHTYVLGDTGWTLINGYGASGEEVGNLLPRPEIYGGGQFKFTPEELYFCGESMEFGKYNPEQVREIVDKYNSMNELELKVRTE